MNSVCAPTLTTLRAKTRLVSIIQVCSRVLCPHALRETLFCYLYITTVETDAVICIPLKGGEEDCADCKYIACSHEETFFMTLNCILSHLFNSKTQYC